MYRYLILLLLFIILILLIITRKREFFTLSLGRYIRNIKKNKFSNILEKEDIQLINKIQKCYRNGHLYYDCINRLGLSYPQKVKPNTRFKKHINYKKTKNINDLFPQI
jgi:hypothetical protein